MSLVPFQRKYTTPGEDISLGKLSSISALLTLFRFFVFFLWKNYRATT